MQHFDELSADSDDRRFCRQLAGYTSARLVVVLINDYGKTYSVLRCDFQELKPNVKL